MKSNFKILNVVLAVALIITMVIPVNAQSVQTTRSNDGCTYAISADCWYEGFYSVMEYQYCDSGDYTDYILQVCADAELVLSLNGLTYYDNDINSRANYRIANVARDYYLGEIIVSVSLEYYLNGKRVYYIGELLPV